MYNKHVTKFYILTHKMLYKISASYFFIAICNITYKSWHQLNESAVPPLYPTRWHWCRSHRQTLSFTSVTVHKFLLVFSHPDAAMIHWTLEKHYHMRNKLSDYFPTMMEQLRKKQKFYVVTTNLDQQPYHIKTPVLVRALQLTLSMVSDWMMTWVHCNAVGYKPEGGGFDSRWGQHSLRKWVPGVSPGRGGV